LEFDDEKYLSDSRTYQVKQEDFRFNILYTDPSQIILLKLKMQLEMQCHFHLIPLQVTVAETFAKSI
jgi:hypothetical protein